MTAQRSNSTSNRDARVKRILEAIARHPPMPALYREILPLLADPNANFDQLSLVIRRDPGVTMNILRVANSSYFSGADRIDSLRQAFVRLGSRRLFQIVLSQGVATRLAARLDGYALAPQMLLNHSVGVAVTAENLARLLHLDTREMLFTAGLLHDMGKVILDPFVQEAHAEFDAALQETDKPFDTLEEEVLGITHADAGARLMAQWSFPDDVVEIVAHHHHPDRAERGLNETLMVHFADALVYSQGVGDGIDGFRYPVADDAAERLGLRPRDIEKVASETLEQLQELEELM